MSVKKSLLKEDEQEEFFTNIQHFPSLIKLIENPFILKITIQVLPRILKETHEDSEITKYRLYSAFMDDWFERQEKKVQEAGKLPKNDIKEYFIEYSLALAKKMDEKQVSHISPKGDFAPFFEETEESVPIRVPLRHAASMRANLSPPPLMTE